MGRDPIGAKEPPVTIDRDVTDARQCRNRRIASHVPAHRFEPVGHTLRALDEQFLPVPLSGTSPPRDSGIPWAGSGLSEWDEAKR